jgi:SAM-dependent methyltransferase
MVARGAAALDPHRRRGTLGPVDATRARWDRYWEGAGPEPRSAAWLEPWRGRLAACGRILEVGCGRSPDAAALSGLASRLCILDFSLAALRKTRSRIQRIDAVACDLRDGLPFRTGTFGGAVASLSLHYFEAATTHAILADLVRCLEPGGLLVARVNSTEDVGYGATGHPEVEPHLYRVEGRLKRFFDAADVERFFGGALALEHVEPVRIELEPEKLAWLAVGRRAAG